MKQRRPTNPELLSAIGYLMKAGKQYQTPLWITIASFLGKSRRTRIVLNLGQVSKNLKGGEVIAVPGKVLGSGEPKEKLTIAAFKFSPRALGENLKAAMVNFSFGSPEPRTLPGTAMTSPPLRFFETWPRFRTILVLRDLPRKLAIVIQRGVWYCFPAFMR